MNYTDCIEIIFTKRCNHETFKHEETLWSNLVLAVESQKTYLSFIPDMLAYCAVHLGAKRASKRFAQGPKGNFKPSMLGNNSGRSVEKTGSYLMNPNIATNATEHFQPINFPSIEKMQMDGTLDVMTVCPPMENDGDNLAMHHRINNNTLHGNKDYLIANSARIFSYGMEKCVHAVESLILSSCQLITLTTTAHLIVGV